MIVGPVTGDAEWASGDGTRRVPSAMLIDHRVHRLPTDTLEVRESETRHKPCGPGDEADDVDRADARHVLHEVFHLGAVAFG